MVDLRFSYRRKGLSDVFIRNSCPPIRAGIIVSVVPKSIWVKDWLFIPTRAFARKYPTFKKWRIAHTREAAIMEYWDCVQFYPQNRDGYAAALKEYIAVYGEDAFRDLVSKARILHSVNHLSQEVSGNE